MTLTELQQIATQPLSDQWKTLLDAFETELTLEDAEAKRLLEVMVEQIVRASNLTIQQKMQFCEKINGWGDPRLSKPFEEKYWVSVDVAGESLSVGKYLVTMQEWLEFLRTEYNNDAHWCTEGLNWRNNRTVTWEELAAAPDSQKYVFDNQPVVGVSWFEAAAYAKCHGARLMDFYEREEIVRGTEKRRYPWGRDFKHGYANTEESRLDKPSAVGLFHLDSTPEGIFDLAGNVAEWQGDDMENQRVMHPGCWANGSISTWAKASECLSPNARLAYLGFRLVKDQ